MVDLSQDELAVITKHPLNDSLDRLQDPLRSAELSYKPGSTSYDRTVAGSEQGPLNTISRLLSTLQGHEAALNLLSRARNGDVASELSTLFTRVRNGDFNYENYRTLSRLVIKKASDVEIWKAVFDLIITLSRTTPPPSEPSLASSFKQTPWVYSTANFQDSSEYRIQVDDILRQELKPSLRIDVPDLFDAVFMHIPQLDELAKAVFRSCQKPNTPRYYDAGWVEWPTNAKEDLVLKCLEDLMGRFIELMNENGVHPVARRVMYRAPRSSIDGSIAKRKMDIGIAADVDAVPKDKKPDVHWSQILVIGELKSNHLEDGKEAVWIDLATYAREVFKSQDRRFVLGFTLCGSLMRLWHFDRSGSSGSCSFDINKEGLKFVKIMLGFHLLDDEQLGFDPTIKKSDSNRYIEITRNDQVERLVLKEKIRKQGAIVGRATTCWKAYREGDKSKKLLVVKDSWQYEERPEEGELIKDAIEKGVQNIARYYHHETVQIRGKNDDTIENVRNGLMKECGRTTFRQKSLIQTEAPASEASGGDSLKRSSSIAQLEVPSSKRSCPSRQSMNEGTSHNRVHRRVITRDVGKAVENATSLMAVINGLIGAINGHQSLFDAGILHRDISTGNIMLTEDENDGFLIDFDLAIKIADNKASGAPSKTGTKIFMAIDALLGEHHTFMHDLESFFWVLFWICIHWNGPGKQRRIVKDVEAWNYKSTTELATLKLGRVSGRIFDSVKDIFTPYCRPLFPCLKELHDVVFPAGSPASKEDRKLYSRMKTVLQKYEYKLHSVNLRLEDLTSLIQSNEEDRVQYLANLGLASTWCKKSLEAPSMVGTKAFMAIGALLGDHHSFMHDLESFFWVLFWICIHWIGPGKQRRTVKDFETWNYESTRSLAMQKAGQVSRCIFDLVEDVFTPYCRRLFPYLKELRDVVFPAGVAASSKEDRELYSRMRTVLEKAREDPEVVAKA